MKKEFVPYEQALELKQLGFDEKCFAKYTVIPEDEIDWLEATPKHKETNFELIRMGFAKTGELREMILRDNFGQFTLLVFSEINFNPNLASELFQFDPPSGADVISD